MYNAANPPNTKEAIEWLHRASITGHVRAQYQLALCLHQGRGVKQSLQAAVSFGTSLLLSFLISVYFLAIGVLAARYEFLKLSYFISNYLVLDLVFLH